MAVLVVGSDWSLAANVGFYAALIRCVSPQDGVV